MCPPARTDVELLAAHRAGDPRAFDELVARHEALLWGIAVRTLRHREDASDAVQEALVAAYRHCGAYRGEASVRTWLTRILLNACLDRIRRDRRQADHTRHRGLTEREPGPTRPDLATELATRLSVVDALAMIPAEQRMAIVLVDAHGWPVAEVAEVLDVPVGTVKSRCARGRARLAVLLGHLREEVP